MSESRKHLLLYDQGLGGSKGHHYSTVMLLGAACAARGVACDVFCLRPSPESEAECREAYAKLSGLRSLSCVLSEPLYRVHSEYGEYVEHFLLAAGVMAEEMDALFLPRLTPDSVILCHTATPLVMHAFARWLRGLPRGISPQVLVNVQFERTDPGEMLRDAALRQLQNLPGIRVMGSNMPICKALAERLGRPARVLPLPLPVRPGRQASGDDIPVFGTAGQVRSDKNLGILPEAIDAYLAAGGKGRFLLQFEPVGNALSEWLRDILPQLQEAYPENVEVTWGSLHGDAYCNHIARCDALILPYRPHDYVRRVSQVALEAAALGVAAITTRGSSLEEDLRPLDNGSVFMAGTGARDLAGGLAEFAGNLAGNRRRAAAAAGAFTAYHNATTYLDIVFDVTETYPYPAFATAMPGGHADPLPEAER